MIAEQIANTLLKNQKKLSQEPPEFNTINKKIAAYSKKLEEKFHTIVFEPQKREGLTPNSNKNLRSLIHNFFLRKVLDFSIQQTRYLLQTNDCKFLPAISIILNEAILQNACDFTLPTTSVELSKQCKKNTQLNNIHYEKIQWQKCSTISHYTKKVLDLLRN